MTQGIGKGSTGEIGEDVACAFLVRKGYYIRERNYRRKTGEIDIIAEHDGVLHFVEVKSSTLRGGDKISREITSLPEQLIHATKVSRIARTAEWYVNERHWHGDIQIDALIVFLDVARKKAHCRYYPQISS